jgi:hypothetical protein
MPIDSDRGQYQPTSPLEIVMPSVITVSHIVVSEFNSSAVFTVRLSEADPVTPVTVSWNLSGLTAASGSDFTNVSGSAHFQSRNR